MGEVDTIESDDVAAEIAQGAMFSDDELERSAPVFLPGFEELGRLQGAPIFEDNDIIDAAFAYYRQRGFPYRNLPQHVSMQQINQLSATEDKNLLGTTVGYHVADTYHPHRFHSTAAGARSPIDSFNIDKYLRRAIEKTLMYGAVGDEFLGIMAIVANTQACSNFRPGFALSYYRRYCRRGGEVVLDTSTGYGGRLVGFLASNTRGTYIGIDPNKPTHDGNVRMMRDLGVPKGYRSLLINLPAEDVDVDNPLINAEWLAPMTDVRGPGGVPMFATLREVCDFSFTSPPYFSKEHYSDDDTQSWVRYGDDPEKWREKFLAPMLRLQFDALKPGAFSCVNIADVKVGRFQVPLQEWTQQAGIEAGFELVHEDRYRLSRRMGRGTTNGIIAFEPVFVFRKPEAKVQIVTEGPATAADIAEMTPLRTLDDSTLCEANGCGHKYAKHDTDDGGDGSCLVRECVCTSFEVPFCMECGALNTEAHQPWCKYVEAVATYETLSAQLATDANLVSVQRPIDEHALCGNIDAQCSHPLVKHDDNEGECLLRTCGCTRFEAVCPDCGRHEGEIHGDDCASATVGTPLNAPLAAEAVSAPAQSEAGSFNDDALIAAATPLVEQTRKEHGDMAAFEVAKRLREARAEAGIDSDPAEIVAAERTLDRATEAENKPWSCPIEDCVRTDRHRAGAECQRARGEAVVEKQTEMAMPASVTRRAATPPPATSKGGKEFSMYGEPHEHCAERKEDGGDRPLSVDCRGCGAPRAHWCNP